MEAGDLDLEKLGINAAASVAYTYVGATEKVDTITYTWVDEQADVTHTWTRTYGYDGSDRVISASAWVHVATPN
jgi:hypothetical protein